MYRRILFSCAALLFSGAASADVTLTVSSGGYNDFFMRCDIAFAHDGGDAISELEITYHLLVGDRGKMICQKLDSSGGCRETEDQEFTCEDMTRIDVLDVTCRGADGNAAACGSVAVQAGEGISVPVEAAFMAEGADTSTRIFATVLGYDDFFEDCEMGFAYQPLDRFDHVEIGYEVLAGGEPVNCTSTLSSYSGTGRSCSSQQDYTCDQVTQVRIQEITCKKDDAEQDCGPVEIRAIEKDLFEDAR